jgi:hypothetical protein
MVSKTAQMKNYHCFERSTMYIQSDLHYLNNKRNYSF